jgi:inner membrane protein
MPSPIAHSVTGYAIAQLFPLNQKPNHWSNSGIIQLLYGVLVALAPDLDFIPQILTGERYHHTFTHSVIFAIGFIGIVWLLGYLLMSRLSTRLLLLALMLYGSHLLLDFFTQGGPGIQLLWPFTTEHFKSSIAFFPETHHSQPLFQHPGHIIFISFELSYAVILSSSVWFWGRRKRKAKCSVDKRKSPPDTIQRSVFHGD